MLGIDYPLKEKLKQFFSDEGIVVRDMLFENKAAQEKV